MLRCLLLALVCFPSLDAQCVMCREAAASQQAEAVEAFNAGIIALALPVAGALVFVGGLLRRHSR